MSPIPAAGNDTSASTRHRRDELEVQLPIGWSHRLTLAGHNEAGHAVGDTGACCQEGDAHDDLWDAERVADDGHLDGVVVAICADVLFVICLDKNKNLEGFDG